VLTGLPNTPTSANGARSVYATDLDGDGDADVLSASQLDDKIAWYENLGGGSFGAQQVITTSAYGARSVYATDLDGDGDADVLSASWLDDKIAWYENLNWQCETTQASNGDFTLSLASGQPSAPYYMFHSFSFLNGTSPGTGVLFGLHISIVEIGTQITAGSLGNPGFGGTLDPSGGFSMTLPGPAVVFLSGQTWYSLGIQLNPTTAGLYEPTAITSITFQ
jgi:hypothetical protein